MYKYSKSTASLLVAMGVILPNAAFSQDGQEANNIYGLEEIIVTARKVGESIQEIPLSVQAFTADTISKQQILNVEDLVKFTPGVVISNHYGSRRNSAVAFRGVASSANERQKQTSSAFLDGVYLSGSSQWVGMNDIERVEMVKGPQSAFFGRATYSGAVNYISKTPSTSEKWGGDIQAIIGDNGRQDLWLSAEGPIIEDKLAIRFSGRYYTYDGAWDNSPPEGGALDGEEYGDIGARQTDAFNVTVNWTPTENIGVKFRYLNNQDDDGAATQFLIMGENNNCGPFTTGGVAGSASYYCGTLNSGLISKGVSIPTNNPTDTTWASELGYKMDATFMSLNADWDIGGSGYTLTSVTGKYDEKSQDYKAQIYNQLDYFARWEDESTSQEFRFSSPQDEQFRWMIGAYYLDLVYFKDGEAGFPNPGPDGLWAHYSAGQRGSTLFGPNPVASESIKNKALFGSLAYDINEQLTLSVELRREEEDITVAGELTEEAMPDDSSTDALAISTANPFGGDTVAISDTFTATLPRVILDYKLSDDTMLYASYSEGNNPGGFNQEVIQLEQTVAAPAFTAETGIGRTVKQAKLVSYEFGLKHNLADDRGFINGSVYKMEQTNQRFRGFKLNTDSNGDGRYVPGSDRLGAQVDFEANGSTDIWGVELAGAYALNENWTASAGYNYMKTDILVYEDALNLRVYGSSDARGYETAQTPEHTANFSVDFNMPANAFGGDGQWFARWDAWYQSESYTWTVNLAETETALMHNLRGGWMNDRYSVTAWIENVLDDDSVLASQRTTGNYATGTLGYHLSLPEPRTFGLTFAASF